MHREKMALCCHEVSTLLSVPRLPSLCPFLTQITLNWVRWTNVFPWPGIGKQFSLIGQTSQTEHVKHVKLAVPLWSVTEKRGQHHPKQKGDDFSERSKKNLLKALSSEEVAQDEGGKVRVCTPVCMAYACINNIMKCRKTEAWLFSIHDLTKSLQAWSKPEPLQRLMMPNPYLLTNTYFLL